MILSKAQQDIEELIKKFDKDFFDFIAEYEALFMNRLIIIDRDSIEDYIQNVKNLIEIVK